MKKEIPMKNEIPIKKEIPLSPLSMSTSSSVKSSPASSGKEASGDYLYVCYYMSCRAYLRLGIYVSRICIQRL
jgi:hypothetical protein